MKCPIKQSKCIPSNCMFGVKTADGSRVCGIVTLIHNTMVIASRLDEKKDGK